MMTTSENKAAAYMTQALQLAERGIYTTAPNPRVGCVLVKNDEVVGQGWHQYAGGPHAEVVALNEAGERARGATVYVTLEPCAHQGRTGPCAEALIKAGVTRVIAAMRDPNPLVAGKGFQMLKSAGITTESGLLCAESNRLNAGFISRMQRRRPYVRLKQAMSADAKTALANGRSQWITGPEARRDVQDWRARSQAIISGVETVLHDDPRLTVRYEELSLPEYIPPHLLRQPLRVILDTQARTPKQARLCSDGGSTLLVQAQQTDTYSSCTGVQTLIAPVMQGRIDLPFVLEHLAQQGINDVLLECGSTLATTFMTASLVDEIILYVAPCFLGAGARSLMAMPALENMHDLQRWQFVDVRQFGADVRLIMRP